MDRQRSGAFATGESSVAPEERVASLYQPDTLLAAQYFENLRRKTLFEPEKRLMFAILEDGIRCYLDNFRARGGKRKRLFEDAAAWIAGAGGDWVFSFDSVCAALDLNPEYVRQGLLRWRDKGTNPHRGLNGGAPTEMAG